MIFKRSYLTNFSIILICTILILTTFLTTYLIYSPKEIDSKAYTDKVICYQEKLEPLKEDTLINEKCQLLVWENWDHFCGSIEANDNGFRPDLRN